MNFPLSISIGVLAASLLLGGCGGAESTSVDRSTVASEQSNGAEETAARTPRPPLASADWQMLRQAAGGRARLLLIPHRPPPSEVVVRDLKEGPGEVIQPDDWFTVRYLALDYRTGKIFEDRWTADSRWIFGNGEINKGWEIGLRGMRLGGIRELLVPSYLAYEQQGAIVYLVKLLKIENPEPCC
jgi:peptidylprolyl isomerase